MPAVIHLNQHSYHKYHHLSNQTPQDQLMQTPSKFHMDSDRVPLDILQLIDLHSMHMMMVRFVHAIFHLQFQPHPTQVH